MKKTKFFKVISLMISVVVLTVSFAACSNSKDTAKKDEAGKHIPTEDEYFENSPLTHKDMDTHITPDLSDVEVMEATKSEYSAKTEEEFVKALEKFANPNGNKYDAMAVLGDFDYNEKGEELLERFDAASKVWHAAIVENVGEKCTVEMFLKNKTPIDISDAKVADWKAVNGIDCEAFSNIKCTIATNYAKDSITLSLDIVKINGSWHFASIASIDKVLNAITTDIY